MSTYAQLFLVLGVAAFGAQYWRWTKLRGLQRRGLYPAKGPVTEEHVRRLIEAGEPEMAATAFRDMTGLSREDARDAVRTMAASMAKSANRQA